MINKNKLALLGSLLLCPWSAHAADSGVDDAAVQARNCFACHGPAGRSPGSIPSIAHLDAKAMATALKQFSSGERPSTVMGRLAKGYRDADIDAIAQYLAGRNETKETRP